MLSWARGTGFGSMTVGLLASLPDPRLFWWACGFFYFGIIVLLVDLWFEKMAYRWKGLGALSLIIVGYVVASKVVFVSAPLSIEPGFFEDSPDFKVDFTLFKVSPGYSELRVRIQNNSVLNYDEVDLVLKPELPTADAGIFQTNSSGVSLQSACQISITPVTIQAFTGSKPRGRFVREIVLLASEYGYRIRCERIPKNGGYIEIIMAVVDRASLMANARQAQTKEPSGDTFVLATPIIGGILTIYGYKNSDVFGPPPKSMQFVDASGSYIASQRIRRFSNHINIPSTRYMLMAPVSLLPTH